MFTDFLYTPLGAALLGGVLLLGGLYYIYGTDGRYQKMEKQEILRLFFLPPATVAASIYWFVSSRAAPVAATSTNNLSRNIPVPPPVEIPPAPEFDTAPAPSTPILTEPFTDD